MAHEQPTPVDLFLSEEELGLFPTLLELLSMEPDEREAHFALLRNIAIGEEEAAGSSRHSGDERGDTLHRKRCERARYTLAHAEVLEALAGLADVRAQLDAAHLPPEERAPMEEIYARLREVCEEQYEVALRKDHGSELYASYQLDLLDRAEGEERVAVGRVLWRLAHDRLRLAEDLVVLDDLLSAFPYRAGGPAPRSEEDEESQFDRAFDEHFRD